MLSVIELSVIKVGVVCTYSRGAKFPVVIGSNYEARPFRLQSPRIWETWVQPKAAYRHKSKGGGGLD